MGLSFRGIVDKWNRLDRLAKLALIVVVVTSIIRIYLGVISAPLNGVESTQMATARYVAEIGRIPHKVPTMRDYFEYMPLYHILSAVLYNVLRFVVPSLAFMAFRVWPILSGIGIVILTYYLLKREGDRKIALIATIFVACFPMLFHVGSYTSIDAEAGFFVLLSIFFVMRRKYIFSVVSLAAAYYFKFTAGPYLIVPLFVIFWGKRKSKWIKTAVLYLFIFMLLVSPWMVRSYMVTGNPVYPFFSDKIGCCSSDAFGSGHCEGRLFHQGIIARHVIGYFGMPSEYIKVDTLMPLYLSPESVSNMSQVDVPFLLPLFYLWYFAILVFCVPVVFGAVKLYKAKPKLFYVTGLVLIVSEFVVWLTILRDRCVTPRYTVPFFLFFALLWSMGCNEIFLRYLKTKLVKRIAMMFVIGVLVFNVIFSAASITYVSHKFSKDFAFYDFVKSNYERGTYFYDVSSDTFIYYTQMFNMKDIAKGVDGNLVFVKQGSAESGVWHFGNGLPSGLESFLVMEREFEHYKFYRINPDRESELLLFLEEQKE